MTPRRPPEDDKFHEECALFGIYGTSDAAAHTALGLHALQHRGQEAAGIVTFDGGHFYNHRAAGLVGDIFGDPRVIAKLPGYAAIGHNRYATTGGSSDRNIQPIFADFDFGGLALAHNGNLTNAYLLRKELVRIGCLFQSTTDTEVINHLIARSNYSTVVDRMIDALGRVKGAYSLLLLTNEALYGVRDPMGVRPLCIGRLDDAWIVTSESCALDIIGARFVRDVEPGEIVIVDGTGLRSIKPSAKHPRRFCVDAHIYFARPDSRIEGVGVYEARKKIGAELARESHVPADVIVPVPDSGVPAAIGYSQQSGIPFELGIIRNHYVGRTFIEPTDQIRHLGVRLKHNANRAVL
ncbi:MAG: amidophosphoribosyltransferase, partial [Rhodospirillaceae bacterium]